MRRPNRGQLSVEERERRVRASGVVQSYATLEEESRAPAFDPFQLANSQLSGQLMSNIALGITEESNVWSDAVHPGGGNDGAADDDDDQAGFAFFSSRFVSSAPPAPQAASVARPKTDDRDMLGDFSAPKPLARSRVASRAELFGNQSPKYLPSSPLELEIDFVDAESDALPPPVLTAAANDDDDSDGSSSSSCSNSDAVPAATVSVFSAATLERQPKRVPREFRQKQRPADLSCVCVDGGELQREAQLASRPAEWEHVVLSLPAFGTVLATPGECPPSPDRPGAFTVRVPQHRRWKFTIEEDVEAAVPPLSRRVQKRHPGRERKRMAAMERKQQPRELMVECEPVLDHQGPPSLLLYEVPAVVTLASGSPAAGVAAPPQAKRVRRIPKNFLL